MNLNNLEAYADLIRRPREEKRMKILVLVVLFVTMLAMPVFAVWEIPSNGTQILIDAPSPGQYYIYISGIFRWGDGPPERNADAEWMFWNSWEEYWTEAGFSRTNDINDVTIDDYFVNWCGLQPDGRYVEHAISEQHIYRVSAQLLNNFGLRIYDTDYHDNLGSLNAWTEPVPEPSSFFALCGGVAGLFAFCRRRK